MRSGRGVEPRRVSWPDLARTQISERLSRPGMSYITS